MLFKLLGLPLTLPAAGVKWVFNTVLEQAAVPVIILPPMAKEPS